MPTNMKPTGMFANCPVCGHPVEVKINVKGRICMYCHNCSTATWINRASSYDLAVYRGLIKTKDALVKEKLGVSNV